MGRQWLFLGAPRATVAKPASLDVTSPTIDLCQTPATASPPRDDSQRGVDAHGESRRGAEFPPTAQKAQRSPVAVSVPMRAGWRY